MGPLLSIITATYNSERTLEETIQSVLNQDCENFEYIIIDGDSKDETIKIIKNYKEIFDQKKIPFTWISEPDKGIYDAWNKGLRIAKGDWISFLGSDDVYLAAALDRYTQFIQKNNQVDFIHSKVKLLKNEGIVKHIISDKWKWNKFKRQMKIAHVGCFHNKKYFDLYGEFNETFEIAGDYEMLLRAKDNLKTGFFDAFTAEMKDGGISNRNILKAFREARIAKTSSGGIKSITAYFDFLVNILKYYISSCIKKIRL